MCSETSPHRLSFSHDLDEVEAVAIRDAEPRKDTSLQESNSEFEFSTSSRVHHEFQSSSADELFYNGVILPVQIQGKSTTRKHTRYGESPYIKLPPRPYPSGVGKTKKENTREVLDINSEYEKKPQSKCLWGFSRSRSLNFDRKKSLICSLPLLSRSNSTGSVTNPKRTSSKDAHKHKQPQQPPPPSLSSTLNFYSLPKSHSGKNYGRSYGYGVRVSPVLNVPTGNLFGLGSILRVGKTKKTKD
ncbi:hypothetical protein L6164_008030 [Bauhinia variegata]|uniref:Uncharacterized protein n=1 Tax=Bauhinia variegata TaxID=167791 RepID=A0ACB9PFK0_BAUVA|nr:hypothetical protein L6164_008030 [Bauhinia variegata]